MLLQAEFWLTGTMFLNNERFCEKRYLWSFGHSGTSNILKLDINKTMFYTITCHKERVPELDLILDWDVVQVGMF